MKLTAIALAALLLPSCREAGDESGPLTNMKDSASYSIGMDVVARLKQQSFDLDGAAMSRGVRDAMAGKQLFSKEQSQELIRTYQREMIAQANEKRKAEGEKLLKENKTKPGVQTTASGLQYRILTAGTGRKPGPDATVTVHYRGMLADGTEFDNSYKRQEPYTTPISSVMKGWVEALQLMPVGSKWELVIPPELAYGGQGFGQVIPPYATLLFEVELLSIGEGPHE